jgi:uncharacterized protein (DUF2147 family)
MKHSPLFLSSLVVAASFSTAASARDGIEGTWKNRPNTLLVRIAPCGDALCGTVLAAADTAKESVQKAGTPHLVGTQVLTGLRRASGGAYSGRIFNPNLNVHAAATITLVSPTVLLVRGCVLAGLICKEQHWTRVS